MNEVGNMGPIVFIFVVILESRTQAGRLNVHPYLAEPIGGKFSRPAFLVNRPFELVKGDLPNHRIHHVLDLAGQKNAFFPFGSDSASNMARKVSISPKTEAVSAKVSGVSAIRTFVRRQRLMHAVAQLVGERHDIPGLAVEIHQNEGMGPGHGRMGEGAGILPRFRRRVDPIFVEEYPGDIGDPGFEAAEGVEYRRARFFPGEFSAFPVGKRRVAVPVVQLVDAKPFRLHGVIAMREFLVILRDRGHQRLDHLVLHEVGKIAAAHRAFMAAPVVLDPFILGERVGYQREQFDVIAKFLADALAARFRTAPSASSRSFIASDKGRLFPSISKRRPAMVSSNNRVQAADRQRTSREALFQARPTTDKGVNAESRIQEA